MLQQQQATLPRRVEPRGPALALPGPRPHPLDALAAEELSRASQCCKAYAEQQLGLAEGSLRFNSVAATVGGPSPRNPRAPLSSHSTHNLTPALPPPAGARQGRGTGVPAG